MLESVTQIYTLNLRWVKRALERVGENSDGLSRKKLKLRLVTAVRRHQESGKCRPRRLSTVVLVALVLLICFYVLLFL